MIRLSSATPPPLVMILLVVQLMMILSPSPLSPSQFLVVNGQEEESQPSLSDQEFVDPSNTSGTGTDSNNNNGIHPDVVSTAGTLTSFVPPAAYSYRSQILYVDRDEDSLVLPPYHRLSANFIRPPRPQQQLPGTGTDYDDRLCEFVETSSSSTTATTTTTVVGGNQQQQQKQHQPTEYEFAPVALLVRLGGCTLQRKIEVALDIRSNHIANNTLWSIMFYNEAASSGSNTDVDDPKNSIIRPLEYELSEVLKTIRGNGCSECESSSSSSLEIGQEGIDQFIFASLSYRTGTLIIDQMDRTSERVFGTTEGGMDGSGIRPELYSEGNERWRFPVSLERGSNPYRPARDITYGNGTSDGERTTGQMMFIWFRFILFGFLACFPCIRFVRLWFGAGGRIRFRRNPETNRIVGLYLDPPTDEDWLHPHGLGLHHGRHGNDGRRRSRQDRRQLLTKEQVVELLPEIQYTRPTTAQYAEDEDHYNHIQQQSNIHESNDNVDIEMGIDTDGAEEHAASADGNDVKDNTSESYIPAVMTSSDVVTTNIENEHEDGARQHDDNNNVDDDDGDDSNALEDVTVQLSDNNDNNNEENVAEGDNDHTGEAATAMNNEEVQEAEEIEGRHGNEDDEDDEEKIYTTTRSTTCSICIDEFEEGELVRLLPRCGHAYHTECILPWLTERQGHCPLCKVPVLTPSQRQEHQQNHETENNEEEESDGEGEGLNRYDNFATFSGGQPWINGESTVDVANHGHEAENEQRDSDGTEGMNQYESGGTPFVIGGGGTAGSGGTPFVIGGGGTAIGSAAEPIPDDVEASNGDNSNTRNDEENELGSQQQH